MAGILEGLGRADEPETVLAAKMVATKGVALPARVPCLDGLRGVSILLVLLAHGSQTHGFPQFPSVLAIAHHGALGVQIFFCISGFLITVLLLREWDRRQSIDLRAFYVRRAFRILPAFLCFILVLAGLALLGKVHVSTADWIATVTYTMNFLPHRAWEVGHLWSLSIEEHFYLIWPAAFLMVSLPRARNVLIGCLTFSVILRLTIRLLARHALADVDEWTPISIDSISFGCLLGVLSREPRFFFFWLWSSERMAQRTILLAASLLIVSLLLGDHIASYSFVLGRTVNAACIAAIVWASVRHPSSPIGRILEWRGLAALGTLSYSLYLWQQLFLNPQSASWACRWPVNLLLAASSALACYLVVERPFLALKPKAKG